ncbi:SAP domain-containing ribonucleoprotein [Manduca sexta]|uniref:SAP domain-containing protein n=1 Tax=Manduca sexta TaxID=7130 RepID=A0A921ZFG0_MANSE|nr:SAP domain-containing ribonucleoprotein [Manduca sexta]KAG6456069.1 hypothetical protein O3G_MSEX009572 [Manduca sexta]
MADSTVADVSKMKVVDLRKELKSRGLSYAGDKAELVARLQAAMSPEEHGDINLDSDEIDSDGVLEDEDDKSQSDMLDTLNEDLALADHQSPPPASADVKPTRTLKRKITTEAKEKSEEKDVPSKKIVLNRASSITTASVKQDEKTEEQPAETNAPSDSNKIKITSDVDAKTRLQMRAKRFGLPVKMTEEERKEARKQRFNQNSTTTLSTSEVTGTLSENLDKLKKRAERFGQSVSKIMTDIEKKEKLEKRKAKFSAGI